MSEESREMAGEMSELSLDEQTMVEMLAEANAIERGKVRDRLEIDGKVWRMRPTSKWQNKAMLDHDIDIMYWQEEQKDENCTREKYKTLNGKIQRAYCKKAAHRLLGRRWVLVPLVFLFTWLKLYYLTGEKVVATINAQNALSESQSFYLANLGSSKRALVLSTMQVGEAVKQLQERKASAESMLDEDALPKEEEDSRSAARSSARRTTKR